MYASDTDINVSCITAAACDECITLQAPTYP